VLQERTEAAPKLDLNQCIFSEKRFDDFEGALSHMARQYGFFIPDVEYLADPEGLVQYLRVSHAPRLHEL
jgi:pre-60S factor REI1